MRAWITLLFAVGLLIAADEPSNDATKKDMARLQGDWAAVSMIRDGQNIPDDDVQSLFRTMKGDQYTVFLFKKVIGKGTFKIDAGKKPKTIDSQAASGPAKGQPILGIYDFEGDTWKICYANPGKDRPTDFTAKEGSERTLAVWEREKK
jgi:uncharacterized protein (TIGR03067 family)